jgi:chaperonin GroES
LTKKKNINTIALTKIINLKGEYMAFKPLANRVLIEREKEVTTTASGIIIPDNAKEKPLSGRVLAVGKDAAEAGISEGDLVVFGKYTGTEITLDGKELLILNSDDILGIIG